MEIIEDKLEDDVVPMMVVYNDKSNINIYNVMKTIFELFKLYLKMAVPALSFKTLYRLVERT